MKGHHILMAGLAVSTVISVAEASAAARTEVHDCNLKYTKNAINGRKTHLIWWTSAPVVAEYMRTTCRGCIEKSTKRTEQTRVSDLTHGTNG